MNKSKVSVVTGAASGIGASLTRQLTERGHFVLGVDINRSELDKLSEETGCSGIVGDLSSEKFNQEVASQVQNLFGKVDSVFLNAGILGREIELQGTDFTTNELDRERYVKARSINFDAVVYGTLAMAPPCSCMRKPDRIFRNKSSSRLPVMLCSSASYTSLGLA